MTPPPQTRRPGRPSAEQSANVREALIEAARDCIVEMGFAAASTRLIAERAGVNPAMINYYFGSKAGLGEAVFRDTIAPLRQRLAEFARSAMDGGDVTARGSEIVFAFLRAYMATLAAHPWIPRIIIREVLPENGCFRNIFFEEVGGRGAALLPQAIAAAQKDGSIDPALDPRLSAVSLISVAVFPFLTGALLSAHLNVDLSDDSSLQAFVQHTQALLGRGLREATDRGQGE